jgi:hypothetical protein
MVQEVLALPEWEGVLTADDRRGADPALLGPHPAVRRGEAEHGPTARPRRSRAASTRRGDLVAPRPRYLSVGASFLNGGPGSAASSTARRASRSGAVGLATHADRIIRSPLSLFGAPRKPVRFRYGARPMDSDPSPPARWDGQPTARGGPATRIRRRELVALACRAMAGEGSARKPRPSTPARRLGGPARPG